MLSSRVYSNVITSVLERLPLRNSRQAKNRFSSEIIWSKIPLCKIILLLRPPPQRNFELIPIVHRIYEFYSDLHQAVIKFPKSDKHSLGQFLQTRTLELLEELLLASKLPAGSSKKQNLIGSSAKLELIKLLVRLAREVNALTDQQYILLQSHLQEVGQMLGGWIRSLDY